MSRVVEWLAERFVFFCGISSVLIVVLIFVFLLRDTIPLFKHVSLAHPFRERNWYPISEPPVFGVVPLILGTLWVTVGAIAISLPLGAATAIFLAELCPRWLREFLKPTIELIAAVPSVVMGFLGLVLLAPWIRHVFHLPTGLTAFTGSVMLAFMALPTIISIAEDAITAVPQDYRHASLALGATPLQTTLKAVVPAARSGILAAVLLGLGRAIGETMTVMMVTGNAGVIPKSLLAPVRTMTATVAAEMGETVHYSAHYHALFFIGFLLLVMTFIVNFLSDLALGRVKKVTARR